MIYKVTNLARLICDGRTVLTEEQFISQSLLDLHGMEIEKLKRLPWRGVCHVEC